MWITDIITTPREYKALSEWIISNPVDKYGFDEYLRILEDKIRYHKRECAVVFNQDGEVIFTKLGSTHKIKFTKKELELLADCILIHNHPNLSTFSTSDIVVMYTCGLKEIRVVCDRGHFILNHPWDMCIPINYNLKIFIQYGEALDVFQRVMNIDVSTCRDLDELEDYQQRANVCYIATQLGLGYTEELHY